MPLESSTYEFLKDIDELKWFWTYAMRPLKPHEVYFISTGARNKRLTEQEREYFQVGRSEMFHKEIITEDYYSRFLRGIRRCESNKLAYLTKAGIPYPDSVLVLYTNIVPTDAYLAMTNQIDNLITIQRELVNSVLKNSQPGIAQTYRNIRHSHTTGQSIFARSFSDSDWLDIDSDIEGWDKNSGPEAIEAIKNFLYAEIGKGNFIQVQTTGGFHWLIRKSKLSGIGQKYKTDPITIIIQSMTSLCARGNKETGIVINEIIRNKNEMIPLPGTVQYGSHIVKVLNKDDFSSDLRLHDWPEYNENIQ
jgi:hypothetical protein